MARPETPRRRTLRRLLVTVAVLVGLVVASVAGVWLALDSHSVRQAVVRRGSAVLERAAGLRVTAGDLRVGIRHGRVELVDVELGVPGGPPLVTARRIVVEFALESVLRGPLVLRRVEVQGPAVDLAAPRPVVTADGSDEGVSRSLPRVERFVVTGGRIRGAPVPASATGYVSDWSVESLEVGGNLEEGVVEVELERAVLRLGRTTPGTRELTATARVSGPIRGPWRVTEASIGGEGVRLSVGGVAAPGEPLAADLTLLLEVEPDLVVPDLGLGGSLSLEGTVTTAPLAGRAAFELRGVHAEAAGRIVGPELLAALAVAGTSVDVKGGVAVGAAGSLQVSGSADLVWRRGEERLIAASAELESSIEGAEATFEAALLPGSEGIREVVGTVRAKDLARFSEAILGDAESRWNGEDLGAAIEELRRHWPRLVPETPAELQLGGPFSLRAEAAGPAAAPRVAVEGWWRPGTGAEIRIAAKGRPRDLSGEGRIELHEVPLVRLNPGLGGRVSGVIGARGSVTDWSGGAWLSASALELSGEAPSIDRLELEATADPSELRLIRLEARFGDRTLTGSGRTSTTLPVGDAELEVRVERPLPQVAAASARLRMEEGTLLIDDAVVEWAGGSLVGRASVPLGGLQAIRGLRDPLASLPVRLDPGPVEFELFAPEVDSCMLAEAFGFPDRPERLRGDLALSLVVDPAQPTAVTGTIELGRPMVQVGATTLGTRAPLRARLGGGQVALDRVQIVAAGTDLEIAGAVRLRGDWNPLTDPPSSAVASVSGRVDGSVEMALLEPYLFGAVTGGVLSMTAMIEGPVDGPAAQISIHGDNARLSWAVPYPVRVSGLDLEAGYADGTFTVWSGRAAVNRGTVSVIGYADVSGRAELQTWFEGLRMRLDYGIRTVLGGELILTTVPQGRPRLAGTVEVDRGLLDRNLDLEREVLGQMMAPVVTFGTEEHPLDRVDLDVAVSTVDGVRVKNNLADLTARWEDLAVGGTAWNPVIRGTVTVDPGGLVFAYGQTIRIDRGELLFTGDPFTDPRVELTTTGSWQDPTIPLPGQEASPLARRSASAEGEAALVESLSAGITGYYGERLASRLSDSLGLGTITLRPVLVFGETVPSARLTLSRQLSRAVALAASLDLRSAQRQTYLLDVANVPGLGAFRAQVFTNDLGREGGSFQQVLSLGGTKPPVAEGPVLGRVVWNVPDGLPMRRLRRTVTVARGEPLPDGAAFDLEVEVEYALRRAGWPAPTVIVEQRPAERADSADLVVTVDPGPTARFTFTGDAPPRALRPGIIDLYRPGPGEAATVDEVRKQAVRVLRSIGYLDPEVEITVVRERPADPGGPIEVVVTGRGGVRAELGPPRFEGVSGDVAPILAARFAGPVERAELSVGLGDADARLIGALRQLGYPGARILSRWMTLDRRELVVQVDPGSRRTVASIGIEGVGGKLLEVLAALVPYRAGGPLRTDLVAKGAAALEEHLRGAGNARATVRTVVEDVGGGLAAAVRYDVSLGPRFRLGEVSLAGNRWSSPRALQELVSLEQGQAYQAADVAISRGRLMRTGVFSKVVSDTSFDSSGTANVAFELVERPRFQIAYGVRWESDVGTSAVADLVDRNLFGRGLTAGLRVRWEPDDRSGRLFLSVPDVLALPLALESYAERRRELFAGLIQDVTEGALQLSLELGRTTTGRIYARYRDTELREAEPDPFFPFELRITHPYVGIQFVHDRRDDLLAPSRGVLATLDVSGSGRALGSDFRYLRAYGQVNLYRGAGSIGGRRVIWAQSVRLGAAEGFGQELIPDVRFYAGGEYSLRGYPAEGVGPVEELGDIVRPVGGGALLIVNEELRVALPLDLTGVAFIDVGGVWAQIDDLGSDLVAALGLGLRASTPVGVLRLDFAVPLDRRPWEPRSKLYVGFGQAF